MYHHRYITILSDYSIQRKTTEKMSKYLDLRLNAKKVWNKKVEVIPVIMGATGIVDRNTSTACRQAPSSINRVWIN